MEHFSITDLHRYPLGFGCLQLKTLNQSIDLIRYAHKLGIRLFDTAAMYGAYTGENEELLGTSISQLSREIKDKNFRNKIFIATKGGVFYKNGKLKICGSGISLKNDIENSLRRLQSDYIDLFYLHRVDPHVCVIESIAAIENMSLKVKFAIWVSLRSILTRYKL